MPLFRCVSAKHPLWRLTSKAVSKPNKLTVCSGHPLYVFRQRGNAGLATLGARLIQRGLCKQGQYVWDISELSHERVEYAFKARATDATEFVLSSTVASSLSIVAATAASCDCTAAQLVILWLTLH